MKKTLFTALLVLFAICISSHIVSAAEIVAGENYLVESGSVYYHTSMQDAPIGTLDNSNLYIGNPITINEVEYYSFKVTGYAFLDKNMIPIEFQYGYVGLLPIAPVGTVYERVHINYNGDFTIQNGWIDTDLLVTKSEIPASPKVTPSPTTTKFEKSGDEILPEEIARLTESKEGKTAILFDVSTSMAPYSVLAASYFETLSKEDKIIVVFATTFKEVDDIKGNENSVGGDTNLWDCVNNYSSKVDNIILISDLWDNYGFKGKVPERLKSIDIILPADLFDEYSESNYGNIFTLRQAWKEVNIEVHKMQLQ